MMRKECPECIIYRSFPNHKGDCGTSCLLELDWDQVAMDLEKHNRERYEKTLEAVKQYYEPYLQSSVPKRGEK